MAADHPPAIADQVDKYQELVTRWRNPSRWPRFRLRTLLGMVTVLCILFGWMMESRRLSPYVAHFVVPVGFRGAIELIPDSPDGVTVTVRDGNEVYLVPRDGLLRIQSPGPFTRWQSTTASFTDGTSLPTDADITPAPDGTVRVAARPDTTVFSLVCTDQDGHLWMYVGLRNEALMASSRGSGRLKPGTRVMPAP